MITIPKIEAEITTLTPIWTGNVDGRMDGIKETGILGSMRWWYEAIIRGLGYEVCDPVNDKCRYKKQRCQYKEGCIHKVKGKCQKSECRYNYKAFHDTGVVSEGFKKDGKVCVCPVCQIFGCTGWSKQFRMRWEENNNFNWKKQVYKHNNEDIYLCLKEKDVEHKYKAVFYPRDDRVGKTLVLLLKFCSFWGGFGASPQLGFGICDVNLESPYKEKILKPKIFNKSDKVGGSQEDFPNLKDFSSAFFCQTKICQITLRMKTIYQ